MTQYDLPRLGQPDACKGSLRNHYDSGSSLLFVYYYFTGTCLRIMVNVKSSLTRLFHHSRAPKLEYYDFRHGQQ